MKQILVTGANGQLGQCLKRLAKTSSNQFIFSNSQDLDISNKEAVLRFFSSHKIDWCINCAAYTQVDKAEEEVEKARQVNTLGAENLAIACSYNNVKLIHISTDFIFDGRKRVPYTETDTPNPLGVYGRTKLEGEVAIAKNLREFFIIRTSWLYSELGSNFMKKIVELAKDRDTLEIVADQIGSPTYAMDLAALILKIIDKGSIDFGIYHFANQGVTSWYDFAKSIIELYGLITKVNPIQTKDFPTLAQRPLYSALNSNKIKSTLGVQIPLWKESLTDCVKALKAKTV